MANVNFNYNKLINGENDHKIGKWATKLSAVIEDTMIQSEADHELTNLLYEQADSDSAFESFVIEDGIGLMKATHDGNKPFKDSTNFVGSKSFTHIPYRTTIEFTRMYLEDCKYQFKPEQGIKARQIPNSYYQTREKAAALGYINGESEVLEFNGGSTPLTTYDGKPLFSNQHVYGVEGGHAHGTQSNLFYVVDANPSSGSIAEYLQQLSVHMRQMKDSNGNAQQFTPDTLLIPGNKGKYELAVRQALGSDYFPGGNNNDINPQASRWNMKPLVDWELGSSDPAFELMVISQDAKSNLGSMFWNRENLEVEGDYDAGTRIVSIHGYCRFSLGHANYRHAARLKIFTSAPSSTTNWTAL